ncbi:family 2 glycosyl transferase [Candidatus Omnitrophus magneticus]|uniref:Family 2 glycosyl transferase n=2 Tax=Candidatus Omnitrophus magneticus TaxID=1609969 RepID=A0A0F0CPI8_9BACT|nr:family 2 glycosyl transferase [Candidatus Omnitrophus magneticus]
MRLFNDLYFRINDILRVNVIVLNYNGDKLLKECLPSIIRAKNISNYAVRVTVIDNESTDNSLKVLEEFKNEIDIILCKNRVLCSFNEVVANQKEEIAVLLNNDMRVDEKFIDPLVHVFEQKRDAFLVCPKCFNFTGEGIEGGRSKGFIKFGWFGAMAKYKGWEKELDKFNYTFQSGFGAVRKDIFTKLGGYDDLYLPGRLEDSDICFRSWKNGFKCYYEPESIIYHKGGETFNKTFGKNGVSSIDSRNTLLFFWKNITGLRYWMEHIFFLPVRLVYWLIKGEYSAIRGVFQAFGKIDIVSTKRRLKKKEQYKITDRAIFEIFLKDYSMIGKISVNKSLSQKQDSSR